MTRVRKSLAAAVAAASVSAVAACGSGDDRAGDARDASPPTTPSTPASAAAYDPLPWRAVPGALGRCGPQPQRVARADFRIVTLRDPGNAVLPAVVAGRGDTVAVLLHQTDGNGLCGWLGFAEEATSEPGVTVLAPDLCGYGEARCRDGYSSDRQTDQVALAVGYAERALGARRVVLVGASMGGSLAVLTAARDDRVDAVVDLSGPEEWRGRSVTRAAGRLGVPALVAMAEDEGAEAVDAARSTVEAAPAGSELAPAEHGHGYELLAEDDGRPTELAGRVLSWIRGD